MTLIEALDRALVEPDESLSLRVKRQANGSLEVLFQPRLAEDKDALSDDTIGHLRGQLARPLRFEVSAAEAERKILSHLADVGTARTQVRDALAEYRDAAAEASKQAKLAQKPKAAGSPKPKAPESASAGVPAPEPAPDDSALTTETNPDSLF